MPSRRHMAEDVIGIGPAAWEVAVAVDRGPPCSGIVADRVQRSSSSRSPSRRTKAGAGRFAMPDDLTPAIPKDICHRGALVRDDPLGLEAEQPVQDGVLGVHAAGEPCLARSLIGLISRSKGRSLPKPKVRSAVCHDEPTTSCIVRCCSPCLTTTSSHTSARLGISSARRVGTCSPAAMPKWAAMDGHMSRHRIASPFTTLNVSPCHGLRWSRRTRPPGRSACCRCKR